MRSQPQMYTHLKDVLRFLSGFNNSNLSETKSSPPPPRVHPREVIDRRKNPFEKFLVTPSVNNTAAPRRSSVTFRLSRPAN